MTAQTRRTEIPIGCVVAWRCHQSLQAQLAPTRLLETGFDTELTATTPVALWCCP